MKIDNMDKPNKGQKGSKQEQFRAWLRDEVELEEYFHVFHDNGLDNLNSMKMVTMDVLNMVGIQKIGHKMLLLRHIAKLNMNDHDNVGVVYNEGSTAYI